MHCFVQYDGGLENDFTEALNESMKMRANCNFGWKRR